VTDPSLFADDDVPLVLAVLAAVDADVALARVLTIPYATKSKGRPAFNRRSGTAYTKPEDKQAEKETAGVLRALGYPEQGNVAVVCHFFRDTTRRVDGDNLLKHVLDAATGVLWVNDDQVTAQVALMALDRARPRTVVGIAPHRCSLVREADPARVRSLIVGDDPLRRALAEEADRA
jgi:Holliday junction resolvase RusA-like endonuclease